MISLSRLEGFYWVAKTGGYARAARAFPWPITQPGVHQQVRRLEQQLSITLFERTGKDSVALTAAGQALFDAVAPFYEALPALEAAIQGGTLGGTLRIHAAGHVLKHFLPPWLRALQKARPDIEVALHEAKTADLELLRRSEADLLVDWVPVVPKDLEAQKIGEVKAFIVVPSSHPLARKQRIDLPELASTPFVAYGADRALRALQDEALGQHAMAPKVTHAADSSETILAFVAAGLGFSLVPSPLPNGPHLAGVQAFPLERPKAVFPIYALWKKRTLAHPLVQAALNAV
jgi:DNA-binding transcriptional LysR family regulator